MRIVRMAAKIVLGAVLLAAIGALAVLLWARTESGRRTVRGVALDQTRHVLPGLEIGRVGGNLTRDLVLEDVRLRDRAGREAIYVERVEARLDLLALLDREVKVERLLLVRPRVDAHANLDEIVQSSGGGGARYDFDLASIELEDGTYLSEGLEAHGLSAGGSLRLDAKGLAATVAQVSAQARGGERRFSIDGRGRVTSSGGRTDVVVERLAVRGALPADVVASGRVEDRHIEADLAIGRGRAHVAADLEREGFRAHVDLDVDPHEVDATLARGRIAGRVTGSGSGWPGTPNSHASLFVDLDPSRIEGIAIGRANLHGHLDGDAWRIDDADVRALGLAIRGRGHGVHSQLALELDATASRPIRLFGAGAAGRIKLSLSGKLGGAFEVTSNFDLREVQFAHDRIEKLTGKARLTLRQPLRRSQLHALHAIAQNPSISGRTLPATIEIDATARPELRVTADIRGRDITAHLASAPLTFGKGVQFGPGELSGEIAGVKVPDARVSASLDARGRNATFDFGGHLGQSRAPVRLQGRLPIGLRGPMTLALDAQGVRLSDLPTLLFARRELRDGRADLRLRLEGDAAAPRGQLELALRDARMGRIGSLAASLRARIEPSEITIEGAGFERSRRVLTWDGRWRTGLGPLLHGQLPWQAPFELRARLAGVDLGRLHALDPRLARASGTLTGEAQIEGSLRDPTAHLRLGADGAQLDAVRFAELQATAEVHAQRLRGSLVARPAAGGELRGTVTWESGRHEVDLHARALDLRFVPALVAGIRESAGTLDADLAITGAGDASGTLTVHKGHLGIRGLHEMNDIELGLRLSPGRADVTRLSARSGEGSISGSGGAVMEGLVPRKVQLHFDARQFELGYGGILHARLDGRIAVDGGTVDDRLALRASVENGHLGVEQIGGEGNLQPTGPLADVRFVDPAGLAAARQTPAGKTRVRGPARDIELAVVLPNFSVRGKEVSAALDGRVVVSATPDGLPIITGGVAVRRGNVEVFGQRFDIEHARVRWSGEPGDIDPILDIRVTRAYADATVAVELTGTLNKSDIHLSSDPPVYDQAQLVAMVLGGSPQSGDMGGPISPAGTISSVILSQIVDKIAPQLPFDIMRVEQAREPLVAGAPVGINDVTETRVEVGKHLTDRITLSYVHLFGAPENQNHNEARVDYRLGRRWIIESAFGDAGVGGLDVFWTWRY